MSTHTVAILGAGNGGFAAAAHLTNLGHDVRLYNRSQSTVAAIQERGGIEYEGVIGNGFAEIQHITTNIEEAVSEVDAIVVCLPAIAFPDLARSLAPVVTPDTPILLNPGSTGGALVMRETLQSAGCESIPTIAETNTLTYICRKSDEKGVTIYSTVDNVRCASVPADDTAAIEIFTDFFDLDVLPTVLHTSLCNVNAMLHPPGVILSTAWIQHSGGDFRFYYDAGTAGVANVMEELDEERRAIASAWNISLEPFPSLFASLGSTSARAAEENSFLRMLRESEPNKDIKAPASTDDRYFDEDFPYGLVPMKALARIKDVETPVIDSLVTLASSITENDYEEIGWDANQMGITAEFEQDILHSE